MKCPKCFLEIEEDLSFCGRCGTQLGNKFVKPNNGKIYLIILIVFVIFIGFATIIINVNKNNNETSSANINNSLIKNTPTPEPEKTWQKVIEFEGESIKDTQLFNISSNEWAISWTTKPGEYGDSNFIIYLYDDNGNFISLIANIIGKGEDASYIHNKGKGNYYLSINTSQPYIIVVNQYK